MERTMSLILNRAKANTTTTGTGTVTLGSTVSPFQSWASAGASGTTRRYSYLIEDGTAWEIGEGVYNSGAGTVTRGLIASSTGALLNLSGSATIASVAKATDSPQIIERKNFAGGETTFSFTDIPQNFTDLEVQIFGRLQTVAASTALTFTLNGITTATYDIQRQYGTRTTNTADNFLAQTSFNNCMSLPGTSYPSGQAAGHIFRIGGYSQSTFHKVLTGHSMKWPNSTSTYSAYVIHWDGGWRNTAAVTSIEFPTIGGSGQMMAGSYAILRGIP